MFKTQSFDGNVIINTDGVKILNHHNIANLKSLCLKLVEEKSRIIQLDLSQVNFIDRVAVQYIINIQSYCNSKNVVFSITNISGEISKFLETYIQNGSIQLTAISEIEDINIELIEI